MNAVLNIGDRVKIVDLHVLDAFYYDRSKLIGTEATVTRLSEPNGEHADEENEYIALGVDVSEEVAEALGRDKDDKDFFFFGVKVEPIAE